MDLDPATLPDVPPPVVDIATETSSAREPVPEDLSDIQQVTLTSWKYFLSLFWHQSNQYCNLL